MSINRDLSMYSVNDVLEALKRVKNGNAEDLASELTGLSIDAILDAVYADGEDNAENSCFTTELSGDTAATEPAAAQENVYVTFRVDGRYTVEVPAGKDMDETFKAARHEWWDADIGGLEVVEDDIVSVTDKDGEFLYEK